MLCVENTGVVSGLTILQRPGALGWVRVRVRVRIRDRVRVGVGVRVRHLHRRSRCERG